jgi:hypothetical protein
MSHNALLWIKLDLSKDQNQILRMARLLWKILRAKARIPKAAQLFSGSVLWPQAYRRVAQPLASKASVPIDLHLKDNLVHPH